MTSSLTPRALPASKTAIIRWQPTPFKEGNPRPTRVRFEKAPANLLDWPTLPDREPATHPQTRNSVRPVRIRNAYTTYLRDKHF